MRIERVALLCAAVLCFAPITRAQGPGNPNQGHDSIFMTVNGLSCNSPGNGAGDGLKVSSWAMGVDQTINVSGGGGGVGKATFQPLVVTRPFDECSPLLLPAIFTGKASGSVTLTQYGGGHNGNPGMPLMVVTLTDAVISSYTIGGDAGHDPAETWTFKALKICVKNVSNNAQACWDFGTNSK